MRVSEVSITSCSPRLYKQLCSLNLREHGQMKYAMRLARDNFYKDAVAHYIYENKKVPAWTLSFRYKTWSRYRSYFYTRKSARRKGLGSKLALAVETYCNRKSNDMPSVYPHDNVSINFFSKCVNENNIKLYRCAY